MWVSWTIPQTRAICENALFLFIYFGGFEMKTLITFLVALFYFTTVNAQVTWTKIESGTKNNLNDIYFSDENIGYFVGEKGIFGKTTNSGNTWNLQNFGINKNNCAINSTNNSKDFVITSLQTDGPYFYSFITTSSGDTFNLLSSAIHTWTNQYYILCFPQDLSLGYYFMFAGGNANWSYFRVYLDTLKSGYEIYNNYFYPNKICFINNEYGILIGGSGKILLTSNKCVSWISTDAEIPKIVDDDLNSIVFLEKNNFKEFLIVGDNGKILKSNDGGKNWKLIQSGTVYNLIDVKFCSNGRDGIILGEGKKILITHDRGETWSIKNSTFQENLKAISIPPNQDSIAYIVGSNCLIIKTTNLNAITDVENNTNISKTDFTISPNPATDNISISFSNSELSNPSISIINSLGFEIKRFENFDLTGKNIIDFSTEVFPSGIYYCSFNSGINRITKSFVVVR
jgi:photosystem II stability/assembly factor-like uncharacterized protein